ncbi:MAG TPA: isoprenylcysteine carboxylmethyltransferase family protein [Gemmatimonadaceae bacterium]|jgi:protein-S-isoprenylcysteine O-methyltransferase Ste14
MGSTSTSHVANPGPVRPPRIFLAAIILGLVGHLFWRDHFVSRPIGIPAGAVLVVAAVALFVGATRAFKAAGTPVPGNEPATAIVNAGPYRFSRNPIYLAFVVFQLGLALLVNSLSLVVTLLPALGLIAFVVIPREERYLMERFPVEYAAYRESVRRWL